MKRLPKTFERRLNKFLKGRGYFESTQTLRRRRIHVTMFNDRDLESLWVGSMFFELPFSVREGTEDGLLHFVATKLLREAGLYSDLQELADSYKTATRKRKKQ